MAELPAGLHPDEMALLDWVRTRLNASIVRDIAALDHGMHVDRHREDIEEMLVAKRLPEPLPTVGYAVLQPASFAVPDDPGREPGSKGWRQHIARLFACLVLVRADGSDIPEQALASLVESAVELGPEATERALHFVAWCRQHEPGPWDCNDEARPFLTLGLLLLSVTAPAPASPGTVGALIDMFTADVEATPIESTLRKTVGAPGRRTWQALIDRHLPDAGPVRACFNLDSPPNDI